MKTTLGLLRVYRYSLAKYMKKTSAFSVENSYCSILSLTSYFHSMFPTGFYPSITHFKLHEMN